MAFATASTSAASAASGSPESPFSRRSVSSNIAGSRSRVLAGSRPEVGEETLVRAAAGRLRSNLSVQLIRGSQLAQISFVSYDRELAATVPNALAEAFIESDLEARMAMTQKATEWLRERMGDVFASQIGVRRLGTPQDVANVVELLVSERGSYFQGAAVVVDGGVTHGV